MSPAHISLDRPTLYVGIDPGASGAVAWIGEDGSFGESALFKDLGSLQSIASGLHRHRVIFAVIEEVSAMPGQGVTSMFSFGEQFGAMQGILAAKEIPYALVRPQTWRKECGVSIPAKEKGVDKGKRTREVKEATVQAAIRRWPETATLFQKKKNWPIADALWLAECARRRAAWEAPGRVRMERDPEAWHGA